MGPQQLCWYGRVLTASPPPSPRRSWRRSAAPSLGVAQWSHAPRPRDWSWGQGRKRRSFLAPGGSDPTIHFFTIISQLRLHSIQYINTMQPLYFVLQCDLFHCAERQHWTIPQCRGGTGPPGEDRRPRTAEKRRIPSDWILRSAPTYRVHSPRTVRW